MGWLEDFGEHSTRLCFVLWLMYTSLKQEDERGRSKKLAVANREFERTLELLNERAVLLSQLADLKKGRVLT